MQKWGEFFFHHPIILDNILSYFIWNLTWFEFNSDLKSDNTFQLLDMLIVDNL